MFRDQLVRLFHPVRALGLTGVALLTIGLVGVPAQAAEAPVGLGTAGSFAVLAGQSVTNTGPSVVTGDIGVGPGTSVTGIPPLVQIDGALHVADAVAMHAQADLTTAYNSAAGRSTVTDVTGSDLGGRTLTTGVVEHTSAMQLTGTLTLDAQGDPSAVFIFKAGSTLITAPNSTVSLINGASPCNVYWQVGSSTTLDTNTTFVGTVMSLTSATMNTGASLQGRMLARNGSVTLDTNVITRPNCATTPSPTPTPTVSPTATPTPTATGGALSITKTPTSSSSPTNGGSSSPGNMPGSDDGDSGADSSVGSSSGGDSSGGDSSGGDGSGSTGGGGNTPVVPVGHPETGLGGTSRPVGPAGLGLLSLLAGCVAGVGALVWRRTRPVRLH